MQKDTFPQFQELLDSSYSQVLIFALLFAHSCFLTSFEQHPLSSVSLLSLSHLSSEVCLYSILPITDRMNEMISSDPMMIPTLLEKKEADKMVQNCIGMASIYSFGNRHSTNKIHSDFILNTS